MQLSLMRTATDLISGFCQQSPEIWQRVKIGLKSCSVYPALAFRSDLFSNSNLFWVRVHLVESESSSSPLPTEFER